jgi:signal transduction histidine kinase
MPSPPVTRVLRRPGLLGALLFLATMGTAGALAWQAARAAASHRAAAETALAHHAAIAAWRFAREARSWVGYGIDEAGSQLLRETSQRRVLPGPEILQDLLATRDCDCVTAAFGRTFFRVTNTLQANLVTIGEPLGERSKDSLIALVAAAVADTSARGGSRQWLMLPPGVPRLSRSTDVVLLWRVGDRERGVRATYGMVVDSAQIARPLRDALKELEFFPPSLVPRSTADSLLSFEAAGPNRATLFAAGPAARTYIGTDTLGRMFGDVTVTVAIDPSAASVLVVGGVPTSRAPTIIALLALAIAMGGAALLLLRREYKLVRLREDFVSGVSHELRTPLTQIRVLSELLASGGFHSDAERARATGGIHREALRLSNLVDNILEFARRRRTTSGGAPTRIALGELLRELSDAIAPLLEAQRNRIDVLVTNDVSITADRDAVTRVFRNLMENAIKYGPPGQTIRVTVDRAALNGGARVTVDDEGPGIKADERQRIWQPYYRLERDRNGPIGGSGLGLSVVAELVHQAGGKTWVEDAPAGGARFTVEFPDIAAQPGRLQ